MIPDVLSLVSWARIHTPYRKSDRWDNHYYLALINDNNNQITKHNGVLANDKEVYKVHWISPQTLVSHREHKTKEYTAFSPTLSLISELHNIINENALIDEFQNHNRRMVIDFCPKACLNLNTKDLLILSFCDDLYSKIKVGRVHEYDDNTAANKQRIIINKNGALKLVSNCKRIYHYNTESQCYDGQCSCCSSCGCKASNNKCKL